MLGFGPESWDSEECTGAQLEEALALLEREKFNISTELAAVKN